MTDQNGQAPPPPGDVAGLLTIYAEAEVVRGATAAASVDAEITATAEVVGEEREREE